MNSSKRFGHSAEERAVGLYNQIKVIPAGITGPLPPQLTTQPVIPAPTQTGAVTIPAPKRRGRKPKPQAPAPPAEVPELPPAAAAPPQVHTAENPQIKALQDQYAQLAFETGREVFNRALAEEAIQLKTEKMLEVNRKYMSLTQKESIK